MMTLDRTHALMNTMFEEVALVIGGLTAVHTVEDDLLWSLMKNLAVLREKTLGRLKKADQADLPDTDHLDLNPHPAVEEFLKTVRADMAT